MKYSLGIDLGTTFSSVATIDENGRPIILMNSQGKPITPSVIYFGDGKPLVGEEAKEMQAFGDPNTASFFKRNMGDHNFILNMNGHDYTPVDLSAIILSKLKADAETKLGCSVNQAVITVPAYFNNLQREATIKSGEIAGLKVLRIINEPTAAALAYGMKDSSSKQTILVYDLGGGTFDVTIAKITDSTIEVIATDGDHELGGKDWDDLIATYLGQRFYDDHGVDPLEDLIAFNDLLIRCEDAKKQLSTRDKARVIISHQGEKETYTLDRSTFEDITKNLMERTQNLTEQVLKDAGLKWEKLTGVLLIGGSTRMPMVWDYVKNISGKKLIAGVNVDEAVVLGAAIRAAEIASLKFSLPGGKRVQDVMSHSLGMIAENENRSKYINSFIIKKNLSVPCSESKLHQLRTASNQENEIEAYMLQGESENWRECTVIGKYVFTGITHDPTGLAQIYIEYTYDEGGMVCVRAKEQKTGRKLPMQKQPIPEDMSEFDLPPKEELIEEEFDPSNLKLLVSEPFYDDIGQVLNAMNLPYQIYTNSSQLDSCDILFLNCGTPTYPDSFSLRCFVEKGGCLYASDLTDTIIQSTFPGYIHFYGQIGNTCTMKTEVIDKELKKALGRHVNITFDMNSWAVIDSVTSNTKVLLKSKTTHKPIMVAFQCGEGSVFYTCFHNHAQASETEELLLQVLVLKQISAVTGIGISKIAQVIINSQNQKNYGKKKSSELLSVLK